MNWEKFENSVKNFYRIYVRYEFYVVMKVQFKLLIFIPSAKVSFNIHKNLKAFFYLITFSLDFLRFAVPLRAKKCFKPADVFISYLELFINLLIV